MLVSPNYQFFHEIRGLRPWDFPFYDFDELKITPLRMNLIEAGWRGGSRAFV